MSLQTVNVDRIEPAGPLSPELVLVLPPELRAQVLASLGPPAWARPRLRMAATHESAPEPVAQSLGMLLVARSAQLGLIFALVTIVTLAMSVVAHALR
jgi:hypothetical protein